MEESANKRKQTHEPSYGMQNAMRLSLSSTVFLAGSGISVDSGLPSGMAFNRHVATMVASSPGDLRELKRILITDDRSPDKTRVRFEQLITLLRNTVDPHLDVLSVFDADVPPGSIHCFLARALSDRAYVFTTNFDSLIERAFQDRTVNRTGHHPSLAVACLNEKHPTLRGCSFQEYLNPGRAPVLFKLHGTLSLPTMSVTEPGTRALRHSIGATLDKIGDAGSTLRLESFKHRALALRARGRTLVVLGYSGLDDFDVIPSLAELLHRFKQVVWIAHSSGRINVQHGPAYPLPDALVRAAREQKVVVTIVRGNTEAALEFLFQMQVASLGSAVTPPRVEVGGRLTFSAGDRAFVLGRLLHHQGQTLRALRRYRVASRLFRAQQNWSKAATARGYEASVEFGRGSTRRAMILNRTAFVLQRRIGARGNAAANLLQRARMLDRLGHPLKALRICRQARHLPAAERPLDDLLSILILESIINRSLGRPGHAMRLTSRALSLAHQQRWRSGAARCLMEMSRIYRLTGRDREALGSIRRAQTLFSMLGEVGNLATAYLGEGNVLLNRGDLDAALAAFKKTLVATIHTQTRNTEAIAKANIGIILRLRGAYGRALRHLHDALAINESIPNPEGIARDTENIALVHLCAGRFQEADRLFVKALQINRSIRKSEGIAITLNNQASSFRLQKNYAAAVPLVREALERNRRLGRPLGIASVLQNRAELEYAAGQTREARRTAESAYRIACDGGYPEPMADAAELLARIAIDASDRRQAVKYLRVASAYANKLQDKRRLRILLSLKTTLKRSWARR